MARFLSPEWFAELSHSTGACAGGPVMEPDAVAKHVDVPGVVQPDVVVEVVVSGAPEGEVRYQVVVEQGRPTIFSPGSSRWPAQVTLSTDYATLSSMASGEVSPIDVLAAGNARISGDTGALSGHSRVLAGLDLMPASVRCRTTF